LTPACCSERSTRTSTAIGPSAKPFAKGLDNNERLVVTIQNMAEFWNVATRPLDTTAKDFRRNTRIVACIIERLCQVVAEDLRSYEEWKRLVDELEISGVKVHDARLVAVMKSCGIETILTLNEGGFRRYAGEGIRVVTPEQFP
jgi:predicted nucleic acid-binding protein